MTTMNLQDFKDTLSRDACGMTVAEAHEAGVCIDCKKPDPLSRCHSEEGRREYDISGMCEECFDALFAEPEPYCEFELPEAANEKVR
jgi:hypothetical protein